jgi:hypothetical protein
MKIFQENSKYFVKVHSSDVGPEKVPYVVSAGVKVSWDKRAISLSIQA